MKITFKNNHLVFFSCQIVMSFPSPLSGALELADSSADLPGLKWMPGVTSWKVLKRFVFGSLNNKPRRKKCVFLSASGSN